jgi:DNA-binding LytR/AlgR family response regulator
MRIHRSHIINLCRVMKFIRHDGVYVQMEDGFKIPVSNSKRELLLKKEEKMNTALIIIMTLMN